MSWSLQQRVIQCVIQIMQCLFSQNDIQTFEAVNGVRKKYCLHTPMLFTHLHTPLYIFAIFVVTSGWFLLASSIVQSQCKIELVD